MYLLDTNVVSELRKPRPHGGVLAWLHATAEADLHLSAVTLGEIQAAGAGTWVGRYLNFPGCRCLLQAIDGRVLSLALPNEVELSEWPRLC